MDHLTHHVCGAGDAQGLAELEQFAGKVRGVPGLDKKLGMGEIPRAQAFIQLLLDQLDVHYRSGKLSYSHHIDQPTHKIYRSSLV